MKVLVIWFLLVDKWLHAWPLMRDLKAIADRGHEVTAFFPVVQKLPESGHENFSIEIVRVRRFLPISSYFQFCLGAMARIVKRHRDADAMIFAVDEYPLALPWLLRRMSGIKKRPMIAIRDISRLVETHSMRRAYRLLLRYFSLRLLSGYADAIFVISPLHAKEIGGKYRIPAVKLHIWPSSVDTDCFDPRKHADDRDRVRKELGVEDRFLIMHHGVFSEERGLYELLEAMHIVHEMCADIALLLLGKGESTEKLKAFTVSHGLESTVIFHDSVLQQDVARFIAAADAGVNPLPDQPQWRVQTPTKVLEYLSMQKPVIVTDIPANRWIVENHPVAFFCGRGGPKEIAEAILRCAHTRTSIPESERNQIVARFSSESVADRILRTIEEVGQS
jgi:glycosyltransferase involved in cell wall biosynthesis